MRVAPTLALLALAVAPAFAANNDLPGFKVTRPAADPCKVTITKLYQDTTNKKIHAVITNGTPYMTVGKLTSAVKVGTALTMDGSNFSFSAGGPKTLDIIVNGNPKGVVKGPDVMLAFTECTVAMH